ncbi:MAG: TonB-dependent receptor [Bacteroidetes bacterium]|nr:TonB-dependent receptor [Bacteroidota bacterium]
MKVENVPQVLNLFYFCHSNTAMNFRVPLSALCFIFSYAAFSQVKISGNVSDKNGEALLGATVKAMNTDSSFVTGTVADMDGNFSLSLASNKKFIILFSYMSYRNAYRNIETKTEPINLGKITMRELSQSLDEVVVSATQVRGEQKGDTTAFNADAYKVNPDANAEDLIKKMPGVTSDGEGVKVNGETVQRVLVDGKPFFGDDPNAALKNLPAEIIDKVEIFDKMSDQSAFTGFNDGNQQKTINIVTKSGKNVGQFGRVYAGGGVDENPQARYNAGAALNHFNGAQRVSLLLLSNNINQQNFSASDITGAMGSSGGGRGRGGNSAGSALMASPQNGNTTTHAAGLNYSDVWGKKINVSGSYFFNYSDNHNYSEIRDSYFTENKQVYQETNDNRNKNMNHRLNFRFEYNIDSANKLTLVPSLSFQNNTSNTELINSNSVLDQIVNTANVLSNIGNSGYDFSNNALFQHKLAKKGRTFSINLTTQLSERGNDGNYLSTGSTNLDQQYNTYGFTKKVSGSLSYTEPLGKFSMLQLNYSPSYNNSQSDKSTNDYDTLSLVYDDFNVPLSNKYQNIYTTQKGGASYRYQKDKLNLSFGADAQNAELNGNQTFPIAYPVSKTFNNMLPNAQLNYKFNKSKNLRIYYRTNTNIPSISQLQSVLDISNPVQVRTGNVDLKQTFANNVNIRFGGFNAETQRNAMFFVNGNQINNYISNTTYILNNDSLIQGYTMRAGSRLTKPVNLNGYYTLRAFGVYGFPLKSIKSNMNFNGGLNYAHSPSMMNEQLNYSNSYAYNGGIFIGSNISEKLDFSLSYNGGYTIVKNTLQTQSNNNYFNHNASFKINWIFYKGFVFNTDLNHTLYNGLTQNFNQQFFLWNAYVAYKFLKNNALEAKISVFDILNQNRSVGRIVNANYTEDYYTMVLRRYVMFTLTYNLKRFKSGDVPKENTEQKNQMFPGGRPPNMGRPPQQ